MLVMSLPLLRISMFCIAIAIKLKKIKQRVTVTVILSKRHLDKKISVGTVAVDFSAVSCHVVDLKSAFRPTKKTIRHLKRAPKRSLLMRTQKFIVCVPKVY